MQFTEYSSISQSQLLLNENNIDNYSDNEI